MLLNCGHRLKAKERSRVLHAHIIKSVCRAPEETSGRSVRREEGAVHEDTAVLQHGLNTESRS